jgi:hypothetical protein
MNTLHRARPDVSNASGDVARFDVSQLLAGLERQREELGPIADELLELLHLMGVSESPPGEVDINPSNG